MSLTPGQRSQSASLAAHSRWAGCADRTAATAAAHAASPVSRAYWERKVAADAASAGQSLTTEQVAAMAESAHRAHMRRLTLRSSIARSKRCARGQSSQT
jgi:hypothetical protein